MRGLQGAHGEPRERGIVALVGTRKRDGFGDFLDVFDTQACQRRAQFFGPRADDIAAHARLYGRNDRSVRLDDAGFFVRNFCEI